MGDAFIAGQQYGRVRAMFDERGRHVKQAGPSIPVEVLGWAGTPAAGDLFQAFADERQAGGQITESDVLLAAASGAIIVGFHVRPDARARELAARERVEIRLYEVIYKVVEELKQALEGMLKPEIREVVLGAAEVRQVFK